MKSAIPREARTWPGYLLWGRLRTSTVVLVAAFVAASWLYETYEPAPVPDQVPASNVVPPGFIPDPAYTWVPRTDVSRPEPTPTSGDPTASDTASTTPTSPGQPTDTPTSATPSTTPTSASSGPTTTPPAGSSTAAPTTPTASSAAPARPSTPAPSATSAPSPNA